MMGRVPDKAVSIRAEADRIARLAAAGVARVERLGPLVLFSTTTGDAWVLDPEHGFGLCLARAGEPQPAAISETDTSFQIDWTAAYYLDGELFIVADRAGGVRSIRGYPVAEIERATTPAG